MNCYLVRNCRMVDTSHRLDDEENMGGIQKSLPLSNGSYRGDYNAAGERHGVGVWVGWDLNGQLARYEGTFVNDRKEGLGKYTMGEGDVYEGEFRGDKFAGKGSMVYFEGNTYVGEFQDGERHGEGKCTFRNGDIYSGQWKHGVMHGYGGYYFRSKASFRDAFPNGEFQFSAASHISYEGYWERGRPNGRGKYYLANCEMLEGSFWNGKRHGPCKYLKRDGTLEICNFDQNVQKGDGVQWCPKRKNARRVRKGKVTKFKTLSRWEAAMIMKSCGHSPGDEKLKNPKFDDDETATSSASLMSII